MPDVPADSDRVKREACTCRERRGGTLRLRGLLEVREDEGADDGHGDEDSPVHAPSSACASSCFLDERPNESFEL